MRGCQPLVSILGLALVLTLGGCGADHEQVRRDSDTAYKLGIAFLSEGRPAPALRQLAKADALTPDNPEVHNAFGLGYWARRELGLAESSFRKALELKPDFAEAWNNLGALYVQLERYAEAVPVLEKAVDNVFYNTQERALTNLGWALHKLGRDEEALRRLGDAIEVSPGFPLAHKNLGMILQVRGDWTRALAELDRARETLPEDAEIELVRGMCLLQLRRHDEARMAFDHAWRLSPRSSIGQSAKTYLNLLQ